MMTITAMCFYLVVQYTTGRARELAELKWYQNVRPFLTHYLWVLVAPKSGLKSGGKSGHPTLFCHTILDPILQLNPVSKFGSKIGWGLLRSFERGTRGRSRASGVAGASQTPTSSAKNLLETPRCVDPCKNTKPLAVMIMT